MTPSLLYLLSTHDQLPDDLGTPIIIHVGYIAFFLGIIRHLYDILQHKQELIQEKDHPESTDVLDNILLGRAVILFTTLAIPYYIYYYIHSDLEYSLYVVFTQEVALRKLIYFLAYTPWLLLKAIVVTIMPMIAGFIIYGGFAVVTIRPFARMLSIPEDYQNLVPLNFNIRTFKLLGITFFFAAVSACLLYVVTYGILAHIEELPPPDLCNNHILFSAHIVLPRYLFSAGKELCAPLVLRRICLAKYYSYCLYSRLFRSMHSLRNASVL